MIKFGFAFGYEHAAGTWSNVLSRPSGVIEFDNVTTCLDVLSYKLINCMLCTRMRLYFNRFTRENISWINHFKILILKIYIADTVPVLFRFLCWHFSWFFEKICIFLFNTLLLQKVCVFKLNSVHLTAAHLQESMRPCLSCISQHWHWKKTISCYLFLNMYKEREKNNSCGVFYKIQFKYRWRKNIVFLTAL